MLALHDALLSLPEMEDLLSRRERRPAPCAVWGLSGVHQAHLIAALCRRTGLPGVVVVPDETAARSLCADLAAFSGTEAGLLPGRDPVFYDVESGAASGQGARIAGLYALASGQGITVVTAEALLLRTLPPEVLGRGVISLAPGEERPPEQLARELIDRGYVRTSLCEGPGQFSVRGGIVDVFSPGSPDPFRIEFFDTEVDTIAPFSVETQRRGDPVERITLLPAVEFLPDLTEGGRDALSERMRSLAAALSRRRGASDKVQDALTRDEERIRTGEIPSAADRLMPLLYPEFPTAADHIPPNALVFLQEPLRLSQRVQSVLRRHGEDVGLLLENGVLCAEQADCYLEESDLWGRLEARSPLMLDPLASSGYPIRPAQGYSIMAKRLPSYSGSLEGLKADLEGYLQADFAVVFLATGAARAERIFHALLDDGVPAVLDPELASAPLRGRVTVASGAVSAGMEYPALHLAVITEESLGPARKPRSKFRRQFKNAPRIKSFTDLNPGDLVVHDAYGIGCFAGIEKIEVDGAERDFIKLRYAGTDSLYLPATQLDQLAKYVGAAEDSSVRLNKLGSGGEWQRTKARAKASAKAMAKELIQLYAQRLRRPGFAFPADSDWQREFEEAFEYEETEDQLRCVAEIKKDMEQPHPMDRLLCGDVGFGKTEVALRAVMKCIMSGKQAAILVPTTVLCRQHYQTALHRFRGYPVKIAQLSRFVSPAEARETLRKLASGAIDLVIGTHKLLQKDIRFKDLGLLVVDEEQRFGVAHKEKLKELTREVDVLTLSATPIPRTLNMALSGIRDLSVLEEAPLGRYPVQTYVMEHQLPVIADAIRRELDRGGQVYYLHNRVESIYQTAGRISRMVPDAVVAVGHGQMPQEELEAVMQKLIEGEINVFVCTTIIEAGVDIPNVNTLIVEDAERYGLAQLHQIRGRVGRSTRHAFAYLTYRPGRALTEIAVKRLTAIREFAEFGAGMKIAMRDLEIRGAGNLLGQEQSGHMMSVGYDMYLKLLEDAVLEERGEPVPVRTECTADLSVSAFIPEKLVAAAGERMDLYRRIAFIRDETDASDMTDEIIDRYGDCPAPVQALIRIARLRSAASAAGISEIRQTGTSMKFSFADRDLSRVGALCAHPAFKGRVLLNAGEAPYLSLRLRGGEPPLDAASAFVTAWAEAKTEP